MPLKLTHALDPRDPIDLGELLATVSGQPDVTVYSNAQMREGLAALVQSFPNVSWLRLEPGAGGLIVPVGAKARYLMSFDAAVRLGLDVARLSGCGNVDALLAGFSNPTQFLDSLFESRVAAYCVSLPSVRALSFAPEYVVKGRPKRPEFELDTAIGTLVCECKSGNESARDYALAFGRLVAGLEHELQAAGAFIDDARVEVELIGVLDRSVERLASEIATRLRGHAAPVGPIEVGPCRVQVQPRSAPPSVDGSIVQHSVRVGSTPTGVTAEYAHLRVATSRISQHRSTAAGTLLREAKDQLPPDKPGVVFLQASHEAGERAAKRRLAEPEYDHVLACGVVGEGGIRWVYRTSRAEAVSEVFGPLADGAPSAA